MATVREGYLPVIAAAMRARLRRRRLAAFCRHMVGAPEDANEIVREVTAAAADSTPALYRLARERCSRHQRPPPAAPAILAHVGALPEPERAALLMREVAGLSQEQVAQAMQMTIPEATALLVGARIALAETRAANG